MSKLKEIFRNERIIIHEDENGQKTMTGKPIMRDLIEHIPNFDVKQYIKNLNNLYESEKYRGVNIPDINKEGN